jgi:hypothetical protein
MAKNVNTRHTNELIDGLKQQVDEISNGKMAAWESDAFSPEAREQYWLRVLDWETAPTTTNVQQLADRGVTVKPPDAVSDEELTSRLWELIDALAQIRVFLTDTDHLSDRELYVKLWRDVIREEVQMWPDDPSAWHVDLLGMGSEEGTHQYLKYFADEDSRRHWLKQCPDCEMPAHEDPPYDRDRRLPRAPWDPPADE